MGDRSSLGYKLDAPDKDLSFDDPPDSAAFVPKCREIPLPPSRGATSAGPPVPWEQTIISEMHVRGYPMRNDRVPEALRGTFAGLADPNVLGLLEIAGIPVAELQPSTAFVDDDSLLQKACGTIGATTRSASSLPRPSVSAHPFVNAFRRR
jgi:glycogen operon protein